VEKFLLDMAEIFEVDTASLEDVLTDFDCWDSLTILSIIANLDQNYSIKKSALEIKACNKIRDIYEFIASK
jgi:acyl carrier protein